ncbi:molybdopterin-binding protein [Sulfitobacter sp. F26204]|uniref:molybdopterin-binding protein n=1 Tax=Sulfitobacter sp. F26204 TaxID=2996014 RepID=UPI00225DD6D9|nr:molybdopterin-binding protein [Sulfitobacter sp. F26204]MCX7560026.1 molybdopterin-binding protein [Sulfitobacter sp. F26204]
MKFGPVPVANAKGTVLAHSVRLNSGRLRKGVLLEASHIAALREAGVAQVVVARLDANDVAENDAAAALAQAVLGDGRGLQVTAPFTGRVNLLATGPGVVQLDVAALEAVNAVDPMITIATVPAQGQLATGGMAATIKIISYAVSDSALSAAVAAAGSGAISLANPVLRTATLIITDIPGGPADKGRKAIEDRLAALDMQLDAVVLVAHDESALAAEIATAQSDLVLVLTGSATSDLADVAPSALRRAGGRVLRFGMPVDPGNLLFVGDLGERPVIGLPGCARSPALNGVDWVLSRIVCGVPVTASDIAGMGVGGLLKEIPSRPQPRRGGKA